MWVPIDDHSFRIYVVGRVKETGELHRMRSRRFSTAQLVSQMSQDPEVEYAEPNWVLRASVLPNDPTFTHLWGLFNTGSNTWGGAGTAGVDIDAPSAWNVTTGTRAVCRGTPAARGGSPRRRRTTRHHRGMIEEPAWQRVAAYVVCRDTEGRVLLTHLHLPGLPSHRSWTLPGGGMGTPTFFINGRKLAGAYPYEKFEQLIKEALAKK